MQVQHRLSREGPSRQHGSWPNVAAVCTPCSLVLPSRCSYWVRTHAMLKSSSLAGLRQALRTCLKTPLLRRYNQFTPAAAALRAARQLVAARAAAAKTSQATAQAQIALSATADGTQPLTAAGGATAKAAQPHTAAVVTGAQPLTGAAATDGAQPPAAAAAAKEAAETETDLLEPSQAPLPPLPSLQQEWSPYLSRVSSIEPQDPEIATAYKAVFNYT